ncbi:MAG TPA: anti-sigma factor [Candidatus Deferrimicrobium sp.]|nr:anti-sigma factor [Candidatus Deferrimicrobium sp.]
MKSRGSRLILAAAAICTASVYFSCTQPEDILTGVSRTELFLWGNQPAEGIPPLLVQNLPSTPPGMIYELWVANAKDTVSLGKFGYDRQTQKFLLPDGEPRPDSNRFVLSGDVLSYTQLFVSVETASDTVASAGPIMLIDDVTLPSRNPIELRFPLSDSLWFATASFSMETPSDSDMASNDGFGIWFTSYVEGRDSVRDTLRLDSFRLVTKEISPNNDTTTVYLDSIFNIRTVDTVRVFGLDTFRSVVVRFDSVLDTDVTRPYTVLRPPLSTDVDTASWFYFVTDPPVFDTIDTIIAEHDTTVYQFVSADSFHYDKFLSYDAGLLDYSDLGWEYKGWVVSPAVPPSALGEFTLPAYRIAGSTSDSLMPGIDGGLLTTGTFTSLASPDNANPYTLGPRVPPIPGEDFLVNLPPEITSWQGFLPQANNNSGTVFITLEPKNFPTDTTNFPLIVFARAIPRSRSELALPANAIQGFPMWNLTHTNDYTRGFPLIVVDIKRF